MALSLSTNQSWWVYALAGVFSLLFGLVAVLWPGLTLFVLVVLFGVFALIDGILALIAMFRAIKAHVTWWPSLVLALIDISAGLFVLGYPGVTTVVLLYAIAFWAILMGLFDIVLSLISAQFLLLVVGILSIVFGLLLLANPIAGALALVLVIGIFAMVRGIVLLIHAFQGSATPAVPT
ncbi:MAG TPA: HdeD family acid-resistance protein [Chloroflexota bacterium]|nr:HdeD family acid-resistance protein [Chloroflexota bacterium]